MCSFFLAFVILTSDYHANFILQQSVGLGRMLGVSHILLQNGKQHNVGT